MNVTEAFGAGIQKWEARGGRGLPVPGTWFAENESRPWGRLPGLVTSLRKLQAPLCYVIAGGPSAARDGPEARELIPDFAPDFPFFVTRRHYAEWRSYLPAAFTWLVDMEIDPTWPILYGSCAPHHCMIRNRSACHIEDPSGVFAVQSDGPERNAVERMIDESHPWGPEERVPYRRSGEAALFIAGLIRAPQIVVLGFDGGDQAELAHAQSDLFECLERIGSYIVHPSKTR